MLPYFFDYFPATLQLKKKKNKKKKKILSLFLPYCKIIAACLSLLGADIFRKHLL